MEKETRVIIIGGGASGLIAAISAKEVGVEPIILERNSRVGKKILATGNGRCNFTNIYGEEVEHYNGKNPKFIYSIFSQFGVKDTIDFFERLGIAHKVENLGKVFPMSDQASSVLDVLLYRLEELGITTVCDAYVKDIKKSRNVFEVILEDGRIFKGDKVVVTTGGKAKPSTGSDGNGFELAKKLGHSIIDIFPGLVQLKLEGDFFKQIQGVKIVGEVELLNNNKSLEKDNGDILFTNYGISGPPILQISRKAVELLNKGQKPVLKVSIITSKNEGELYGYLIKRFNMMPNRQIDISLVGLINKRMINVILKESGINDIKCSVSEISRKDIRNIAKLLTDWRFSIIGNKSWIDAQVTAGGINTKEINQSTLESKKVQGLYFAGEIIDIDGQCGGFNLQWAWSSGYVAGKNAALATKA